MARPVSYDPQLQPLVDHIEKLGMAPISLDTVDEHRARMATIVPPFAQAIDGRRVVAREVRVPAAEGSPGPAVTVLSPEEPGVARAAIVFIHGGGMVLGDRSFGAEYLAHLVEALGVVAITVEYRLAPEHPYPAAIDDCAAAWVWTVGSADELGIDATRILVMGESAGGGLAAALSLRLRDHGGTPPLAQVLLSPMLDSRNDSTSTRQFADRPLWNQSANATGWAALLGPLCGGAEVPSHASPSRATDLSSLPQTFIDVGSAEIFRDEVIDYASRLLSHGTQTELHVWPGGFHGFEPMAPHTVLSQRARITRETWLRHLLTPHAGSPTSSTTTDREKSDQ